MPPHAHLDKMLLLIRRLCSKTHSRSNGDGEDCPIRTSPSPYQSQPIRPISVQPRILVSSSERLANDASGLLRKMETQSTVTLMRRLRPHL